MGSCVGIPTGPYYKAIYPEETEQVWSYRTKMGDFVLRMKSDSSYCYMSFIANREEGGLIISWSQTEGGIEAQCRIHVHKGSLEIDDLDTGEHFEINVLERTFSPFGARLNLDQPVDLAEILPGYAVIDPSKRKYTTSLHFMWTFNDGSLPKETQFKVPDILLGDRTIQLQSIKLIRYKKSGGGWWYTPVTNTAVKETKPAGKAFGSLFQTMVFKPADVIYEDEGTVRLSVASRGVSFVNKKGKKDYTQPWVSMDLFIEVLSGEPIQIENDQIDTPENISLSLKQYTTNDFSERLDHSSPPTFSEYYSLHGDSVRTYIAVIPGYHPKRFRVSMPRIDADGQEWLIEPFSFEYMP